jgi:hypothetical protein
MGAVVAVLLALLAVGILVPLAYVVGRTLWNRVEPEDDDPGGKESPPPILDPNLWYGTPFVETLRLSRRLRRSESRDQSRDKSDEP